VHGVSYMDVVLGTASFFSYLLIVLIVHVGIYESTEVGRNPDGCSKLLWPIVATTCSTLMICFVMCETVECAHIVKVFF
jgi:hypothetical protein